MQQKLDSRYIEQVKLLIDVLPYVGQDKNFALKGGTAINLFFSEMPRLSVDIDLCYLPLTSRNEALEDIRSFTQKLSSQLSSIGLRCRSKENSHGYESTLFVQFQRTEIKVEINLVVRGSVYQPVFKTLCPTAKERFQRDVEIQCLNHNDVFGGKICAALDRQHPRDLFDIHMFFKGFSYSRELHLAVMVYLLSGNRPISELIMPNKVNLKDTYERHFDGMSFVDISLDDLEITRDILFNTVRNFFTSDEKEFLISFKMGVPKWGLFPLESIKNLPSVKWKLYNIQNMGTEKRLRSLKSLEHKLLLI